MREFMLEKIREAEKLAAQAPDGSETQAGWMRVAATWRMLSERLVSETEEPIIVMLN